MRTLIIKLCAVLCAALLCGGSSFANIQKRVALVIGNEDYVHADKLTNPVNDSRAMRDSLRKLSFDVVYGENLNKRDLERLIGRFATTVRGADVAIVYFAGHGATFGDTPYIVPVDARFTSLDEMPYELVPLEAMIGELRKATGVRIAVVDACRDNAAEKSLKSIGSRGGETTRGLAPPRNPDGLIVAYATQYLQTAADGYAGRNSPFTQALLNHLPTPGLDIKALFYKVGQQVVNDTYGKQRPEIKISLFDDFALVGAVGAPVVAVPPQAVLPSMQKADEIAWSFIETTTDAKQLENFISRYPYSAFMSRAKARLIELKPVPVTIQAPIETVQQPKAPVSRPQTAKKPEKPVDSGRCFIMNGQRYCD